MSEIDENPFNSEFQAHQDVEEAIATEIYSKLDGIKHGDIFQSLNLKIGDKIKVLWVIQEEEQETEVWWESQIIQKCNGESFKFHDNEFDVNKIHAQIYELEYIPMEPYFQQAECCKVCFLSDKELFDIGTGSMLSWKSMNRSDSILEMLVNHDIQNVATNLDFSEAIAAEKKAMLNRLFEAFLSNTLKRPDFSKRFLKSSQSKQESIRSNLCQLRNRFVQEVLPKLSDKPTEENLMELVNTFIANT